MSELDSSAKRLDAAISRLESAVDKRGAGGKLADAEQQRLEKELAALRSDFDHLRESSANISTRLDTAIGRLKDVLEEGA